MLCQALWQVTAFEASSSAETSTWTLITTQAGLDGAASADTTLIRVSECLRLWTSRGLPCYATAGSRKWKMYTAYSEHLTKAEFSLSEVTGVSP